MQQPPRSADRDASSKIRVLGVDDDPEVLLAIHSYLRTVDDIEWIGAAGSAENLIQRCQRECPDIVLLDLLMPGPDVYAVMTELRKVCPRSRVIVVTSHDSEYFRDRVRENGAWAFISKFELQPHLLDAIRAVAAAQQPLQS